MLPPEAQSSAAAKIFQVHRSSGTKLGIPSGIPPRRFRGADTVAIRKSPGFTVDRTGTVREWPIEELTEINGQMTALGPWIRGTQPLKAEQIDIETLKIIASAADTLKNLSFPLGGFYQRAFRRTPGGGLFVFPPVLASWMRESAPLNILEDEWERWTHPDLIGKNGGRDGGEASWSHSLGVLAWRMITGTDLFADERGEERRERIRRGVIPLLELYRPGIASEPSAFITASLGGIAGGLKKRPGIEAWRQTLEQWETAGLPELLGTNRVEQNREQNQKVIQENAAGKYRLMEKRLRTRRWMRCSGWKFLGLTAVLAVILSFVSAPIRSALAPPVTAGMPPIEVAETYYRAVSDLDAETMHDCLYRKAGKSDRRQVDMIYVTHRVRQGYEGLPDLPAAAQWLADGRPELPPGIWPWGVTNLQLDTLPDGRIEARYLFWMPAESGNIEEADSQSTPRIDILTFKEHRRSWRITDIQRSFP